MVDLCGIRLWTLYILVLGSCVLSEYSSKQSVIIDTDAGADDAMAILMLLSSQKINIEAITCVEGNTGVKNVSINVLKTLAVANRLDIPVYVGSATGIVYSMKSDHYFGYDGLGDFEFPGAPSTDLLQKEHAAVALAERVKQKPGLITIITIGPLTNIALASLINPNFFNQVKNIIMMGGSYKGNGNMGPGIEFNVYADAEAAASVFNRIPNSTQILLLPYETVVEKYFSMIWRVNVLGMLPSYKMAFLNLAERKPLDHKKKWNCFDPTVAAVMLYPKIVTKYLVGLPVIDTETRRGFMNVTIGKGNVNIITDIDRVALKQILLSKLS